MHRYVYSAVEKMSMGDDMCGDAVKKQGFIHTSNLCKKVYTLFSPYSTAGFSARYEQGFTPVCDAFFTASTVPINTITLYKEKRGVSL